MPQRYPVDEVEKLMIRAASSPQGQKAVLWPGDYPVRSRLRMWLLVLACWPLVGGIVGVIIVWLW